MQSAPVEGKKTLRLFSSDKSKTHRFGFFLFSFSFFFWKKQLALVMLLAHAWGYDEHFEAQFIVSMRAFVQPLELLGILKERYEQHVPLPDAAPDKRAGERVSLLFVAFSSNCVFTSMDSTSAMQIPNFLISLRRLLFVNASCRSSIIG